VPALGAAPMMAGLAILLAVPVTTHIALYECAFLFLASPLLIVLGLNARCSARTLAFCRMGERLSYPLYALHRPLLLALLYGLHYADLDSWKWSYVSGGALLALGAAHIVERHYDRPVRSFLAALPFGAAGKPARGTV